jgi:hypothetical protein
MTIVIYVPHGVLSAITCFAVLVLVLAAALVALLTAVSAGPFQVDDGR